MITRLNVLCTILICLAGISESKATSNNSYFPIDSPKKDTILYTAEMAKEDIRHHKIIILNEEYNFELTQNQMDKMTRKYGYKIKNVPYGTVVYKYNDVVYEYLNNRNKYRFWIHGKQWAGYSGLDILKESEKVNSHKTP